MDIVYLLGGSPVPLKPDQHHCPYCSGYGYKPTFQPRGVKTQKAEYCYDCGGSGWVKNKRSFVSIVVEK